FRLAWLPRPRAARATGRPWTPRGAGPPGRPPSTRQTLRSGTHRPLVPRRMRPLRAERLRAVRAEPEDVDDVRRAGEPMLGGHALGPGLDLVGGDLDGEAAVPADQVVMVAGRRAGAIDGLALGRLQRVRLAAGGEVAERAVDRGQP